MSRLMIILGLTAVLMLTLASVAWSHPSEHRADRSTFGGPHCHINLVSGTFAFPSHNAHVKTGLSGGVFSATTCP